MVNGPLSDLTVLDCTQILAGPIVPHAWPIWVPM